MKIVCGSCGAKYSIADEKVQGKVFKIRCKKCSNVIVVKGDSQQTESQQQEGAQEAGTSGAYGGTSGAAEWYVVVGGDQVGPIPPEEVEAYYASGQIDADSFAWRDGLGDWVALRELDEFAHLTGQSGDEDATAIVESPFRNEGAANDDAPDDATSVMPADDFRAQIEENESAAVGAEAGVGGVESGHDDGGSYTDQESDDAAADSGAYAADGGQNSYDGFEGTQTGFDDDGGGYDAYGDEQPYADDADSNAGMFASFDTGAEGDDTAYDGDSGDEAGSEAQQPSSDGGMQSANDMIGQRSENSVLFSLSSLDQVDAVSSGDSSGAADAGEGVHGGDGAGNTEGSGLIDIQALASAHKVMKGGQGAGGNGGPAAGAGGEAADDPFGAGTMSMPALMPMGSHKSNKGLIIGLAVAGFAALGAIGAGAFIFLNKDDDQEPQQKVVYVEKDDEDGEETGDSDNEKAAQEEAAAAAKAVEEENGQENDGEGDDEGEGDDQEVAENDEDGDKDEEEAAAKKDDGARKSASKSSNSSKSRSKSASSSKSTRTSASNTSSSNKDDDDIGNLIDGIDSKKRERNTGGSASSGGSSAPKKDVPKSLSRSMVKSTVKKWDGRVKSCYRSENRNKLSGTVFVKYTVQPSGSISSANVTTDKFKGTDVGKCVEGVVKRMKFPESQNSLTINYPFKLK